jgi:indolepyruvate ferredoxin oxidoreductase, beta subunit
MTRPLRISIHALGGQGGGVLADWVVNMAEHEGWTAQSTSVPGVAQRTGATLYYVELAPPSDRQSVLALMPTPGDVDIVIAAELMEAGRAIARGLVTPERTVLIASSHRVFAIAEKSAMGDGVISPAKVLDAAERCSKRLILADFAAIAEQCGSVVSASLFGALAASGAMPFEREAFEDAVRRSGRGVERSLAAFEQAFSSRTVDMPAKTAPLPASAEALTRLGTERLTDFQDRAYADLYLMRIGAIATADAQLGGHVEGHALTAAAARHLALWMSYEDAIRVADLKTRPERHERVRTEALAGRETVVHITEFMHPRIEEIADILPRRLGEWLLTRRWGEGWLTRARFVTTTRLSGFMLLWVLARFRRLRPRS